MSLYSSTLARFARLKLHLLSTSSIWKHEGGNVDQYLFMVVFVGAAMGLWLSRADRTVTWRRKDGTLEKGPTIQIVHAGQMMPNSTSDAQWLISLLEEIGDDEADDVYNHSPLPVYDEELPFRYSPVGSPISSSADLPFSQPPSPMSEPSSIYSVASSRTDSTDYGLFYTRHAPFEHEYSDLEESDALSELSWSSDYANDAAPRPGDPI